MTANKKVTLTEWYELSLECQDPEQAETLAASLSFIQSNTNVFSTTKIEIQDKTVVLHTVQPEVIMELKDWVTRLVISMGFRLNNPAWNPSRQG